MALVGPDRPTDFLRSVRLGLSSSYYKMSHALGLRRLQDLLSSSAGLPASSLPVHILGQRYENPEGQGDSGALQQEVWNLVLSDLLSRIWMTYREGFSPIQGPGTSYTSDVGWGCTIRSGQMLLAQALLHHLVGRAWRRRLDSECPAEVQHLLAWFLDQPASRHAFSIHAICAAGRGTELVPGQWLGPWVLCHALETCVNRVRPGGLSVHVVASPGGGAPVLYASRVHQLLEAAPAPAEADCQEAGPSDQAPAVLILVPLMLGMHGKLNARYQPQLQRIFELQQSVGIVGGRPGSSLYFVGCQGGHVLFLDPHEVQPVVEGGKGWGSYFCSSSRSMALASIDPSLALGFYCASTGDLEALCAELASLESASQGAPLLCVQQGGEEPDYGSMELSSPLASESHSETPLQDWEVM